MGGDRSATAFRPRHRNAPRAVRGDLLSDTRPIALDAMGGDHAPHEIVAGAVHAVRERGLAVVLVGSPKVLYEALADHDATKEIPIVRAEEALAMDEGALASLRRPR